MKFYYIILIVLSIKIIINLMKLLQCKFYMHQYFKWVNGELKGWSLTEAKQNIISLIEGASVKDCFVSYVEPAGYGIVNTANVSVLRNFPHARRDMVEITVTKFHEAIGVYKRRIFETINPLYWFELLIFLPKKVSSYFGVKTDKVLVKFFQAAYWLITITIGFIYALYKTEIDVLVKTTINNIIK